MSNHRARQAAPATAAHRHAQQLAVIQAGRRGVEGVDLIVKPFVQAIVDVAHRDHDLTHHRLLAATRPP